MQVNPTYHFTTEQEGEFTKFIYQKTPVSMKAAMPLSFYAIVPAIVATAALKPEGFGSAVFIWLFITLGLGFGSVYLINYFRKSGEFKVSKTVIIADDKTYNTDHISTIYIKDPNGLATTETVYISNHRSISQGLANVSREVGNSLKRYISEAGYKIVIRHGTKDIAIAKGMGEIEADILFKKVTEIAGYTKSV